MGNVSERTRIESRMLSLKIRRQRIQEERQKLLKELEIMLETNKIIREPIPNYVEDKENIILKKKDNYYYEVGGEYDNFNNKDDIIYNNHDIYQEKNPNQIKNKFPKINDYFNKYLQIGDKKKSYT